MEEDLVARLMKQALGAAAGKAGGVAADMVMKFLGLSYNDAAQMQADLAAIKSTLGAMDTKLTTILNQIKWQGATQNFDAMAANVQTYVARIAGHLGAGDQATRDASLGKYLQTAQPSIGALDTALTDIDNRIMGRASGVVGLPQDSLFATLIETQWAAFAGISVAEAYRALLEIYQHAAQFQRVAASILVSYYTATGDMISADQVAAELEPRLLLQYGKFLAAVPPLLLLDAMENSDLSITFDELRIEPKCVRITSDRLDPSDTPDPKLDWVLQRQRDAQNRPRWTLSHNFFYQACEGDETVTVEDVSGLGAHGTLSKVVTKTARFIKTLMVSTVAQPLLFELGTTEAVDRYRLSAADGSTLGYLDRGDAGMTFELTGTPAKSDNGYVELKGVHAAPNVGTPKLHAWSRAYANNAAGEGRFKPGFRVRYRVIHRNRIGESGKSDWLQAPNSNQDANGYFDGNGNYYFPQIALANDPLGRTEGYRIFRQFQGDAEEEIAVGSYSGDPSKGEAVIFDDFTP